MNNPCSSTLLGEERLIPPITKTTITMRAKITTAKIALAFLKGFFS
jgi:hypothetical protein